jgi:hypothetical protein
MRNYITYSLLILLTVVTFDTLAQKTVGKIDYPDSIKLNKEYKYEFSNDTIKQTITIKAIGDEKLWFDITTFTKDIKLASWKYDSYYTGTAKLDGAFGYRTDKDMYFDQWDYKTPDNVLTISIYGVNATSVGILTASFSKAKMILKE